MKTTLYNLAGLAILFLVTACNPKYYIPNTQNVPLLKEKGQVNLTAAGNGNQLEVQGAYGITDHLGVMANTGFFMPKNDGNGNGGSGKLGEIGLGYFTALSEHVVFETYGLVGVGNVENHFPSTVTEYPGTSGNIKASMFRFGIQPNIGYSGKYFMIAFSSRMAALNYNNISGNLYHNGINQVNYLNSNTSSFLLEPALTIRGGLEKVKLQLQLTRSFNLSHPKFQQDFSLLTIGLNFNLR